MKELNEGSQVDSTNVLLVGFDPKEERSEKLLKECIVKKQRKQQTGTASDKTTPSDLVVCPTEAGDEDLPDGIVAFIQAEEHDGCLDESLNQEIIERYTSSSFKQQQHHQYRGVSKKRPLAQSTLEGKSKAAAIAEILRREAIDLPIKSGKPTTTPAIGRDWGGSSVGAGVLNFKDDLARRMTVTGGELAVEETENKHPIVPKTSLRSSANLSNSLIVPQVGAHAIGGEGSRRRMRHSTVDFSSGSLRDSKNNYRNLLLEDDEIKDLISGDLLSGPIVPAKLIRCGTENDDLFDDTLSAHLQIRKEHRNSVTAQLVINMQDLIDEDDFEDEERAEKPVQNALCSSYTTSATSSLKSTSKKAPKERRSKSDGEGQAIRKKKSWKCVGVLFGWCKLPKRRRRKPASTAQL